MASIPEPQGVSGSPAKRAIEESFPIVEINRLAIPERNAFKPIYQMHKWFARRASCVFRAILLGALKPAGTDIMEEFYKDHTCDPDTNGKVILDPFMGGGTTVVEALRLGCKVIGIDLNPVAWFIVKTEVEPVDPEELKSAFERLANRKTVSGRSVREELLSHYRTRCPACGNDDADIIYVFWVKSAICTNPDCKKQVPLFSDYLVAQKLPSIRFFGDARCPHASCGKTFDWEIEPAALVGDKRLMLASALDGAGEGRGNRRWTYSPPDASAQCPWCSKSITPKTVSAKPQKKKVRISVFYCPHCAGVFQYRGTPTDEIECPGCLTSFLWGGGNVSGNGRFKCPNCGQGDTIIESIRRLPDGQLLATRMYGLEGYCSICAGNDVAEDDESEDQQQDFLKEAKAKPTEKQSEGRRPTSLIWKNKGKFFTRIEPPDEQRYQEACQRWEDEQEGLPYPKQRIPAGYNTNQMIKHNHKSWRQMFNARQLLCLGTLAKAVLAEDNSLYREMLLMTFSAILDTNNMFTRFMASRNSQGGMTAQGVFSEHVFQPKATIAEQNVWGAAEGGIGTWRRRFALALAGKQYCSEGWEVRYEYSDGKRKRIEVPTEKLSAAFTDHPSELLSETTTTTCLLALDSLTLRELPPESIDHVITDPPYAGNVNYAELTDFYYVWLNSIIGRTVSAFAPEHTPKLNEIIVNPVRGKTFADFERDLAAAFCECRRVLKSDGILAFTYHHSDIQAWDALLRAVISSGFEIQAVYPVQSDAETSTHLATTSGISYDLVHVCRKRGPASGGAKRAWATIKADVRREARKEIERLEKDVYGSSKNLSPADKLIVLIGKCLQLYSRHYNAVVDDKDRVIPLSEALKDIRMLVDQLVSKEHPLPTELEDIDRPSYVYLTALSEKREIKSDDVHKATRELIEVDDLLEAGLMKRGRAGRGRTFEVKTPTERFSSLLEKFKDDAPVSQSLPFDDQPPTTGNGASLFIDRLHFLIGLAEGKESLRPWIERWRGEIPQIRAACEYLLERRKDFAPALKQILTMIDVGSLGFE
jgi:putative DNA methylase